MNRSIIAVPAGCISGLILVASAAQSQTIKFEDLDGSTIDAAIVRDQLIRRYGKQFPIRATQAWRIVIGPGEEIEQTVTPTVRGPQGQKKGKPRTGNMMLGKSMQISAQGGGQAVWRFGDDSLTFLRTYPQGAYRAVFSISWTSAGFACSVSETFGREGGGGIAMNSAFDGAPVTVLSSKQVSSTCRIGKS